MGGRKFATNDDMAKIAATTAKSVVIEQPKRFLVALEVRGTAPLIQNSFSQKTIEQMLRKHMGISNQQEKKVPAECIKNATILNTEDVICLPPTAFKKAMLTAAMQVKGFKKTQLRTSIFIVGGSIPIAYSAMVPQMDMVRTSGMSRNPDVRFRPRFDDWSARLVIEFGDTLAVQSVVDLLNRAGSVGVGEWRPEKDGTFGTFEVSRHIGDKKEIDEIRRACRPIVKPLTIPEWALNAEIDPALLKKIAGGNDAEDEDE